MPSLPDPNDTTRQSQVASKAADYQWHKLQPPKPELWRFKTQGVPGAGQLPELDLPTERWKKTFDALVEEAETMAVASVLPPGGAGTTVQGLIDIARSYSIVAAPKSIEHYHTDASFGGQRLAGAHPLVIQRVTNAADFTRDTEFRDSHFEANVGVRLEQAVESGRVFMCDFELLADFTHLSGTGTSPVPFWPFPAVKFFEAPIAVFYWEGEGVNGRMRPVGVQIDRHTNAEVITPKDTKRWPLAKLAVQSADAQIHELDSHALRCHFILEVIKVAAERTLHADHPLLILLRPHLRMLLAVNDQIENFLFQEGDNIDQLLAPPLVDGSHAILEQARRNFLFHELADWGKEIEKRQMTAEEDESNGFTIDYPYRDDGKLLWDAILSFVTDYVNHYYFDESDVTGDAKVAGDIELQNFVREIITEGRVLGFPRIGSKRELCTLLARIIWSSGPLHAALNFSQWDFFGFVANSPFALYAEFPDEGVPIPNFEDYLPNLHGAYRQCGLMYALSSLQYDQLGFYEPKDFDTINDPDLAQILHDFQCKLGQINGEIFRRNHNRKFPYPFLLPSQVPNSTSI